MRGHSSCGERPTAAFSEMRARFLGAGWCRFGHDAQIADWVQHASGPARAAVAAAANARWLRCGGTWFAGVNVLPNDDEGAVAGGPPLRGAVIDFIDAGLGLRGFAWERAQVSVIHPGYPQPMEHETEAAFRYRCTRDAAHVDGLLPEGPARRRHLREHHGFLLGLPLTRASADAAPFVVWEGSHDVMRDAFRSAFAGVTPAARGDVDVTAVYRSARRQCFARCRRIEITARPGEAYLVHRLALHGMAPWGEAASAGPDGRVVVYFRPIIGDAGHWLDAP